MVVLYLGHYSVTMDSSGIFLEKKKNPTENGNSLFFYPCPHISPGERCKRVLTSLWSSSGQDGVQVSDGPSPEDYSTSYGEKEVIPG